MDIEDLLLSGILEQYVLGLLSLSEAAEVGRICNAHPEVKKELLQIEEAMEKMAAANSVKPNPLLRQKILGTLGIADELLDINNLPPTTRYSNYQSWLAAVEHLIPKQPFDDFFAQVLHQDDRLAQMLVVTKLDVPKETHADIAESFFILKGQCRCIVGEKAYTLNPGDYLDIPLHLEHNVEILTPHVIAILQHKFSL